ncbi:MAG TPA: phosphotransferase family protein [Mycobacterium sp.]|nr:phosphotransferase family protein [Mycobacterium sp.]
MRDIRGSPMTADALSGRLPDVLAPVLGPVTIEGLHRLTGGASRATWAFDAVTGAGRRALILRTGPPDDIHANMETEARAQAAASAAGAPVPGILVADNSTASLGNPFLICEAIPGETVVRRVFRVLDSADEHARDRLLVQCAQALAAVHRADPSGIGVTDEDPLSACRDQLDSMGDTTATFEWAFRWLADHRPPGTPARLVHGDFRMGNLIVDGSDLAAVLDWELVHLGDVCEDLAWFCIRAWRFGAPAERAAGGLGSIESFLTAYQQAGGAAVDPARLHWWRVLATLRWGVICRWQAERHLSGQTRSVELATIGRRVAETEWDLLDLLGAPPGDIGAAPEQVGQATSRPTADYGRPTAAELVAAVAEFLDAAFLNRDGRGATDGQIAFHARVAANALRIVERELLDTSAGASAGALTRLGFADEATLAAAIRSGELDPNPVGVAATLRTLVRRRLAVAHPGYDGG